MLYVWDGNTVTYLPTHPQGSPVESLESRVRWLIDEVHHGSVNAAATAIGIPQQTLAQIASGQVRSPRAATLEQIAGFYDTSLEWLVSGKGRVPDLPTSEQLQLARRLSALDVPPHVADALQEAADAPRIARLFLGAGGGAPAARAESQAADAATRDMLLAWVHLLEELEGIVGPERLRTNLVAFADFARLGFTPLGARLLIDGELKKGAMERAAAESPRSRYATIRRFAATWAPTPPAERRGR